MILTTINRVIQKFRKIRIWQKYGNKTKYHFLTNPNISVDGEETYGVPSVEIYDDKTRLAIGRYCSIAGGCKIILGGNHHIRWTSTYAFYQEPQFFPKFHQLGVDNSVKHGDVIIGNDVWIGRDVLLLPGTTIDDGAIIGGGSVVAGHIPAYAIAVGNPCKVIKFRFTEMQIDALLKIAWWQWDHVLINEKLHLICNDNVDLFIEDCNHNMF